MLFRHSERTYPSLEWVVVCPGVPGIPGCLPLISECWWSARSALGMGQPKAVTVPSFPATGAQGHYGVLSSTVGPQRNLQPNLDMPGWNSLWMCLGSCTFLAVLYAASITCNSPSERI